MDKFHIDLEEVLPKLITLIHTHGKIPKHKFNVKQWYLYKEHLKISSLFLLTRIPFSTILSSVKDT